MNDSALPDLILLGVALVAIGCLLYDAYESNRLAKGGK